MLIVLFYPFCTPPKIVYLSAYTWVPDIKIRNPLFKANYWAKVINYIFYYLTFSCNLLIMICAWDKDPP